MRIEDVDWGAYGLPVVIEGHSTDGLQLDLDDLKILRGLLERKLIPQMGTARSLSAADASENLRMMLRCINSMIVWKERSDAQKREALAERLGSSRA